VAGDGAVAGSAAPGFGAAARSEVLLARLPPAATSHQRRQVLRALSMRIGNPKIRSERAVYRVRYRD